MQRSLSNRQLDGKLSSLSADIEQKDWGVLIVPVFIPRHWSLCDVTGPTRTLHMADSLPGDQETLFDVVRARGCFAYSDGAPAGYRARAV